MQIINSYSMRSHIPNWINYTIISARIPNILTCLPDGRYIFCYGPWNETMLLHQSQRLHPSTPPHRSLQYRLFQTPFSIAPCFNSPLLLYPQKGLRPRAAFDPRNVPFLTGRSVALRRKSETNSKTIWLVICLAPCAPGPLTPEMSISITGVSRPLLL